MKPPKTGQLRDFTTTELDAELDMRRTIRGFVSFAEGCLGLKPGFTSLKSRRPAVSKPRHIIMAAIRELHPEIHQIDIARAMGLTNASIVAYAQRQGEDELLLRKERDGLVAAWRVIQGSELDLEGIAT